jgi:hypothetical protein
MLKAYNVTKNIDQFITKLIINVPIETLSFITGYSNIGRSSDLFSIR